VDLKENELAELRDMINDPDVPATIATRARVVIWNAEHRPKGEIVELAGLSLPTVNKWISRYESEGIPGLVDQSRGASREQVPASIKSRVVALTRATPPAETGLTHWSSRELAKYVTRTTGVRISWHLVAKIWRENKLQPWRQGTFKISNDPDFEGKVLDIVGLYLDPPEGAVVLSYDEKTQVQALDRTQPLLPLAFDATEKRTHDYVRHGTTNLLAALNVGTGTVFGECHPSRTGDDFLKFIKKAVAPHEKKEIHIVLDNLSTHTTPEVMEWLEKNPHIKFHFTPKGSSWLNQIETWFGIITKQSIRRGTFTSVKVLIKQIRDYIEHWNSTAAPFVWTATAGEILAKVKLVQTNVTKLVDNNHNR
jgi:transposase